MLGKKLNLSTAKLDELKLLLNLHNIGKIALVDEIMSKKGRLTRDEWDIIKVTFSPKTDPNIMLV